MEFDRNTLVSELENLPPEGSVKAESKPQPKVEDDTEEVIDAAPIKDEDVAEDLPEDSEIEAKESEEEEQLDPQTAKALQIRQREERRAKEAHQKRMAEVRQAEAQAREIENEARRVYKETIAEKQRLDSFKGKILSDPVGVMRELGLPEDMYEYVSKQFYLLSKRGMENPKARELAERERRSRESDSRLDSAMRKIEELEQREQTRLYEQERQATVGRYLDDVVKAVGDEHKLVKKWLAKAPNKVRERLYETANDLATKLGYAPEPDEVLNTLESARRAELEELGITLPSENVEQPATKKKSVTLSSDMGASRASSKTAFKNREDEVNDVRQALERGQFD